MRYTKFIALLAILCTSVACFNYDEDIESGLVDNGGSVVSIYGNITRFADCDVNTRANKTPDESYVSNMALAIFPIEGGTIGNCINYSLRDGSNLLFTLDRADIDEAYANQNFAMYIFANMPSLPTDEYNGSLDDLLALALPNPSIIRPEDGFPMIGSLGDADRDGKTFVLMPMANGKMELPRVNGTPTDYLNIPMNALFAKISFEIAVSPNQDVATHDPSMFEITSYEIHNLATSVAYNDTKNIEGTQAVRSEAVKVSLSGTAQGGNEGGGTRITFDFYLPERLLTPATSAENYVYPLGDKGTTVTGYSNIPAENQNYAQRYKPKLLGDDQKPTYITINGKFRDHQEYYYDVSYDIYLGEDNYGDFNIKRNNHYINKINIKGLTSSKDQAVNQGAISIDHRVTVNRTSPLIISLRRETLLDAHYEVRPLRLRISGGTVPDGATATVEVLDADWVRLEKSGSNANTYITSGTSAGKRKYFTTDLVTSTLATSGKSITFNDSELKTDANSTVWIYVDEADPDKATTIRSTRSATIRVTYSDNSGAAADVKDYVISQYNMLNVVYDPSEYDPSDTSAERPYLIECYEEYLYNYDSEDSYGQTIEEGLQWGLDGVQLSNEHNSFKIEEDNDDWEEYVASTTLLKYDFYIGKYDTFDEGQEESSLHNFAGQHFTEDIYKKSNGGVKIRTMDEMAEGAVEYCYNRNKRNSDGSVAKVEWYLPSADEMEDIIVEGYGFFKEFQDNYYWTSQPAYIRNAFYYQYTNDRSTITDAYAFVAYEDNKEYARATKVVFDTDAEKNIYAQSGLNKTPEETHDMDTDCINKGAQVLDDSYFNVMYGWYRTDRGWSTKTFTTDDHFNAKKDSRDIGRYHVHLGHLLEMKQEGYQERTKPNRIRCAYRKVED